MSAASRPRRCQAFGIRLLPCGGARSGGHLAGAPPTRPGPSVVGRVLHGLGQMSPCYPRRAALTSGPWSAVLLHEGDNNPSTA